MSFQIKDKKKISLFRKCVQIVAHEKDDFFMHLTKSHIRIFNGFSDDSTYMIDFEAPWFSKFMAPDVMLTEGSDIEILQLRLNREIFLQSFNLLDDIELEFLVTFDQDGKFGNMKVIKTRELYIIEANVGFDVDRQIHCDENYDFPEDQLLLNSNVKYLKNLKDIFKAKTKQEVIDMSFYRTTLQFKGEQNVKFDYELNPQQLASYGKYLSNGADLYQDFQVSIALKHLLSLIKVCDLIEGNFMSAMEVTDNYTSVIFLFSHTHGKDFKFTVGIGGCRFRQLLEGSAPQSLQGRLRQKAGGPTPMTSTRVTQQTGQSMVPSQVSQQPVAQQVIKAEPSIKEERMESLPPMHEEDAQPAEHEGSQNQEDMNPEDGGQAEAPEQVEQKKKFYEQVDQEEFF